MSYFISFIIIMYLRKKSTKIRYNIFLISLLFFFNSIYKKIQNKIQKIYTYMKSL